MYYDGTTGIIQIAYGANNTCAERCGIQDRTFNRLSSNNRRMLLTFLHLAAVHVAERRGAPVATVTDDYDGDAEALLLGYACG